MILLGVCRHRYTHDDRCGLTVVQTRFGPGHVAAPKWAHYPVLSTPAAAVGAPANAPAAARVGGSPTDLIGIPVSARSRVGRSETAEGR